MSLTDPNPSYSNLMRISLRCRLPGGVPEVCHELSVACSTLVGIGRAEGVSGVGVEVSSSSSSRLSIADALISSAHAELLLQVGPGGACSCCIRDTGSRNGTMLNGSRLPRRSRLQYEAMTTMMGSQGQQQQQQQLPAPGPSPTFGEFRVLREGDEVVMGASSIVVERIEALEHQRMVEEKEEVLEAVKEREVVEITETPETCLVCGKNFSGFSLLSMQLHVNECLERDKSLAVALSVAAREGTADLGDFSCPICSKSLTHQSEAQRQGHVDRCLKKSKPLPAARKNRTPLEQTQPKKQKIDETVPAIQALVPLEDIFEARDSRGEITSKNKRQSRILTFLSKNGKEKEKTPIHAGPSATIVPGGSSYANSSIEEIHRRIRDVESEIETLQERKKLLQALAEVKSKQQEAFRNSLSETDCQSIKTVDDANQLLGECPSISIVPFIGGADGAETGETKNQCRRTKASSLARLSGSV